jgi:uncharacterized protein YjbJ (UPF0337 family)
VRSESRRSGGGGEIIAANGYSSRIRVVPKHSARLDVAEDIGGRADILVSEIVSNDLLAGWRRRCSGAAPSQEHIERGAGPGLHLSRSERASLIHVVSVWPRCGAVEIHMVDRDRVEGAAKNLKGKVKEGVGKVTGDAKLKSEGKADQVEGKVQNAVGGLKDTVRDALKR